MINPGRGWGAKSLFSLSFAEPNRLWDKSWEICAQLWVLSTFIWDLSIFIWDLSIFIWDLSIFWAAQEGGGCGWWSQKNPLYSGNVGSAAPSWIPTQTSFNLHHNLIFFLIYIYHKTPQNFYSSLHELQLIWDGFGSVFFPFFPVFFQAPACLARCLPVFVTRAGTAGGFLPEGENLMEKIPEFWAPVCTN